MLLVIMLLFAVNSHFGLRGLALLMGFLELLMLHGC